MAIEAVLFDWNETLFHEVEDLPDFIANTAAEIGRSMTRTDAAEIVHRGTAAAQAPEMMAAAKERDRSQAAHRNADRIWFVAAGVDAELIDSLYERYLRPETTRPYPDVRATLEALRGMGVKVGVLSNCGWNLRRNFAHYDLEQLVDSFTLSCELGLVKPGSTDWRPENWWPGAPDGGSVLRTGVRVAKATQARTAGHGPPDGVHGRQGSAEDRWIRAKPEPGIYRHACRALGVEAEAALMVGDRVVGRWLRKFGWNRLAAPASGSAWSGARVASCSAPRRRRAPARCIGHPRFDTSLPTPISREVKVPRLCNAYQWGAESDRGVF